MVPFILVFVVVVIGLVVVSQTTWIGAVMRGENKNNDPLANMTYIQARDTIDAQLSQGLAGVGASKYKVTWKLSANGSGKPEERSMDAPVELSIDTSLSAPDLHKQVVEPIKPYLEKAEVQTVTMTDAKSHATWTYNVTPGTPVGDSDAQ